MMHEVRSIPTAPRRIRLRPLLAHRWPLFFVGALCVVAGSLCSWMLFLASGAKPSDQRRLDLGPVEVVSAVVERVDEPTHQDNGAPIEWPDHIQRQTVHYSFTFRDLPLSGASFAKVGVFHQGDLVDVELLPQEPNRNRIRGTLLHLDRAWLQPETWLGVLVVPGILLLLGWLAGVFQLWQVLSNGDVSVGTVTYARPVRFVLPEMLSVRFEFRDHRARVRSSRHWVRLRSELGMRLLRQQHTGWFEPMPVLHDRRLPQWNRMLLPLDFLSVTPPPRALDPRSS
jgi:hypothetical protein